MKQIVRTINIEDLIDQHPGSVQFLIKRNLPCLVCGEPSWGTLEELARDKGMCEKDVDVLLNEMNVALVAEKTK